MRRPNSSSIRASRTLLIYDVTVCVMAFLLFCGLVCNVCVRPLHYKHHMSEDELARECTLLREDRIAADADLAARCRFGVDGVLAWLAVGMPFLACFYIATARFLRRRTPDETPEKSPC
jgi:hypothetical protein